MTSPPGPSRADSLVDRLRRQYGPDVDPGVQLEADAREHPPSERRRSGESSGIVGRLKLRGAHASRYTLEGEVARGGMGAILEVWDEDLRRHLAMKVALGRSEEGSAESADELDPRLLSRFLEEAQVTGQLEHPGIVPVHELGVDGEGRAYFTMRLVRGRDLEDVLDLVEGEREGWTVTRALGVLLKVCEAMAYAHSKGVIHRDLKPANVMVGRFGEVYVMDWGLVRVQGHADRHDVRIAGTGGERAARVDTGRREDASGESGAELYTMDGDVVGTPAYMPPEQARGELDALDHRTDVYSVGAMLYRILAGATPYGIRGSERGAAAVLTDLLAGPPRPVEEVAPSAPPELVAVCDKAMAREAADRYADMEALADDLRAYLEGRVVRAYETGALAEARKWVRRNRALAASLAAGLLALVGGLVASLVLQQRADASAELAETRRREAVAAAALAEERRVAADASASEAARQARIAQAVNDFLNDDLFAAVAPGNRGVDVTVREVLAVASLRLAGQFRDEPQVEARLRETLGWTWFRLGDFDAARANLERARELHGAELGEEHERTLDARRGIARTLTEKGRYAEAADALEAVLASAREALGPEHELVHLTTNDLALALQEQARPEEALRLLESALEGLRRTQGREHLETRYVLGNLGNLLGSLGRLEEAEAALREVYELGLRAEGARSPSTLTALTNLAVLLRERGRFAEAEELLRESLEAHREVFGADHPDTGVCLLHLGIVLLSAGRPAEAQPRLEQSLAILRPVHGDDHVNTLLAANGLAIAYTQQGRLEAALELRLETLAAQQRSLGHDHVDTLRSMASLGVLYRSLGRPSESEEVQREALALQREALGPEHPVTLATQENLSSLLFSGGRYDEAQALLGGVLEGRARALGPDHPDVARTTYNLAMFALELGDAELARTRFEQALEKSRAALGDVHPQVAACLERLASLRYDARDYAAAVELYREALAVHRDVDPDGVGVGDVQTELGLCFHGLQDYASAVACAEEALAVRRRELGADDPATLFTHYCLGQYLVRGERFAEAETVALDYHARVLELHGEGHAKVLEARALVAGVYKRWGRPEEQARWE